MNASELAAFWKDFNHLYNENGQLYHRVARSCGLSDCALWLLYTLRAEDTPLTQTQLSETLSLSRQTVNSALKKLVEAGYLRLEAADGNLKNKQVLVTEAGTPSCAGPWTGCSTWRTPRSPTCPGKSARRFWT